MHALKLVSRGGVFAFLLLLFFAEAINGEDFLGLVRPLPILCRDDVLRGKVANLLFSAAFELPLEELA